MNLDTINTLLDALDKMRPQSAMSDYSLVLGGWHQAIADVRATLTRADGFVSGDGSLADYIDPASLVVTT